NIVASLTTNLATGEGNDTLSGIEGLEGSDFSDTLTGSNNFDDILRGFGFNDTLHQTFGADILDGGADSDTIHFTETGLTYGGTKGVTVNLATHQSDLDNSSNGDREVSTLISIENVIGTAGNDVLTGGDPAHGTDSFGNRGTELFRGMGGNDV